MGGAAVIFSEEEAKIRWRRGKNRNTSTITGLHNTPYFNGSNFHSGRSWTDFIASSEAPNFQDA